MPCQRGEHACLPPACTARPALTPAWYCPLPAPAVEASLTRLNVPQAAEVASALAQAPRYLAYAPEYIGKALAFVDDSINQVGGRAGGFRAFLHLRFVAWSEPQERRARWPAQASAPRITAALLCPPRCRRRCWTCETSLSRPPWRSRTSGASCPSPVRPPPARLPACSAAGCGSLDSSITLHPDRFACLPTPTCSHSGAHYFGGVCGAAPGVHLALPSHCCGHDGPAVALHRAADAGGSR